MAKKRRFPDSKTVNRGSEIPENKSRVSLATFLSSQATLGNMTFEGSVMICALLDTLKIPPNTILDVRAIADAAKRLAEREGFQVSFELVPMDEVINPASQGGH